MFLLRFLVLYSHPPTSFDDAILHWKRSTTAARRPPKVGLKCPQKTVAKANMCKVVYDDYYWGLVKCFSAKTRIADSPAPKCASHQNVCREQTVCIAQCVRLIKERQRNILCMIVRFGCMHFMTARLFWLFKLQSKGSVTNDHRSLAVNGCENRCIYTNLYAVWYTIAYMYVRVWVLALTYIFYLSFASRLTFLNKVNNIIIKIENK